MSIFIRAGLFAAFLTTPAWAQEVVDPVLLEHGKMLYGSDEIGCVHCHQDNGSGNPPDFPALAANAKLEDATLIVHNITRGAGAMPAFPDLSPESIAALATYVRNSWGNGFGGIGPDQVVEIVAALPPPIEQVSVWTGVYSQAQADRGKIVYSGVCGKCHGRTGNGAGDPDQPESPSVARAPFLRKWDGQSLGTLFSYIHTTMPYDNPGSRSEQDVVDVIAYILSLSKIPTGESDMPPDPHALAAFVIHEKSQ